MNECVVQPGFDPKAVTTTLNKWIIAKTADCAAKVREALDGYRFNDAANAAYHFTWGSFCDWYLEFAKPVFNGDDAAAKAETRATAAWALDQILIVLHPFMPYITEELWGKLAERPQALISTKLPDYSGLENADALAEMDWVVDAISAIRSVRAEMNVPPSVRMPLLLKGAGAATLARLETHRPLLLTLARLDSITVVAAETAVANAAQIVVGEATAMLPLEGIIDIAAEKTRLTKEVGKLDGEIKKLAAKLGNEAFVAKAKPEVVEEQRDRLAEFEATRAKLADALSRLA